MILEIHYEGIAQVSCPICEEIYEIPFQGSARDSHLLVKECLTEEGWRKGKCPNCK